jgi:hypothetical protein
MVWYYDPRLKKRSILHYPPLYSTLTLSKNIISKIYLWINLWITIRYTVYMDYTSVGKDPSSINRDEDYKKYFGLLGNNKDNIKIITNFISGQQCDDILEEIKYKPTSNKTYDQWKDKIILANHIPIILKFGGQVKEKIHELYPVRVNQVNVPYIVKWSQNDKMEPHVDDLGTDQYHMASLIYLNDDYSGGEISFISHGLSIKPNKGDLIIFPGNLHYAHEVKEVLSGYRYTIPIWYRFVG